MIANDNKDTDFYSYYRLEVFFDNKELCNDC